MENNSKAKSLEPRQRVLLGMSGGVDSSVSAILLLEQGYEVIGGFMKNWSAGAGTEECDWRDERRDAMRVAAQLGIEFHTFDFEDEYRKLVYEYMISEYKAGRTPNPDVLCNKYMKFDLFLREADKLSCDFIATGHYARKTVDENGVAHLLAGVDANKDQSYFLCQLTQEQISRSLFPIGHLEKPKVRELAKAHDLVVADKKDSQGICFIGQVTMKDFLAERITPHEGNIVTTDGKIIGQHQGFEFYTIGQREGLGIGGGTPLYVVERKPETNEVIVAVGDEDPALYRSTLTATDITETIPGNLNKYAGKKIQARVRYRQPLAACSLTSSMRPATISVLFDVPQRAIASGQFVAFYDGEELLGSGIIA
ncbi:MAG: tRNA 2-thiouridine(34) synthase MnmA [Patescibacteria group bacterium]|jgi:tRNA-specific 2-thiouridylase